MTQQATLKTNHPDWGFRFILTMMLSIAMWLLAMPFVPAIAMSSLYRFHLRTASFWVWAVQQPIPSMYNFANRTQVRDLPPADELRGLVDPLLFAEDRGVVPVGVIGGRTINHFPAREITFSDSRLRYLRTPQPRWFVLTSSYRGIRLETVYEVRSIGEGVKSVSRTGPRP